MGVLEGKNVVIIGASGGIGFACAQKCLLEGASVCCSYRTDREQLDRLSETSQQEVKIFRLDLSERENIGASVKNAVREFGGIDILINCAGVTSPELLFSANAQNWERVISDNLLSVFSTMQSVIVPMIMRKKGSIVNVSSVYAFKGGAGQSSYGASKAGIIALTKSAAVELAGKGIRVNAVAPGYIQTAMTDGFDEDFKQKCISQIPMKRFGTAEEVADLCLFLSSDKSSYITGQAFIIDGGLMA